MTPSKIVFCRTNCFYIYWPKVLHKETLSDVTNVTCHSDSERRNAQKELRSLAIRILEGMVLRAVKSLQMIAGAAY